MAKIKICGLSRPIDMEYVNEAHPDYIGFVFAKSKRQVSIEQAKYLKSLLNPEIQAVGVFVNENIENIILLCNQDVIDLVQLHGDEDANYISQLRSCISKPIIKAVRVKGAENIQSAQGLGTEYLLLDAYKEGQYGGSGDSFDWTVISKVKQPYFLAGGIHTENVLDAIKRVNPYAIDVSSGVETDGVKDRTKIIDIITKVRSVE